MKKKQLSLLLHPLFLLSLVVLIINDLYCKQQFHNLVTGKLSDFAGLTAFTIFLFAVLPYKRERMLLFVAAFFFYWKSPLAGPLINYLNTKLGIPVSRVIDYSDLVALVPLPFLYKINVQTLFLSFAGKIAVRFVGIITVFAFCATTMPYRDFIFRPTTPNEIIFKESFDTDLSQEEVLQRFDPRHTGIKTDSIRYLKVSDGEGLYYRLVDKLTDSVQWLPVSNSIDSSLFVKRNKGNYYIIKKHIVPADTLRNLEITLHPSDKRKAGFTVSIYSFQTNQPSLYEDFYNGKLRKEYKKYFKRLLKK